MARQAFDLAALRRLRRDQRIFLADGRELWVKGAFLSTEGIVLTAKEHPTNVVAQNVPLAMITEVDPDARPA